MGLEPTPDLYVAHLIAIFRQVKRVLRDDGTLWLNLGDSYAGSWGNYHPHSPPGKHGQRNKETVRWNRPGYSDPTFLPPTASAPGLKRKDLVGSPWMVAFALRDDGWYLRSEIIWHKPNSMPESVRDRVTRAHEYVFLLAKSRRYYYDHEAIQEPLAANSLKRLAQATFEQQTRGNKDNGHGANPNRSVRRALVNLKQRAVCPQWEDMVRRRGHASGKNVTYGVRQDQQFHGDQMNVRATGRNKRSVWTVNTRPYQGSHTATFPPDLIRPCILAGCPKRGTVLDPFAGVCTTGMVALAEGRQFIGIELNREYLEQGRRRLLRP